MACTGYKETAVLLDHTRTNLYFEYNPGYGTLYDVGTIQTIQTVHPEHSTLVADQTILVNPGYRQKIDREFHTRLIQTQTEWSSGAGCLTRKVTFVEHIVFALA